MQLDSSLQSKYAQSLERNSAALDKVLSDLKLIVSKKRSLSKNKFFYWIGGTRSLVNKAEKSLATMKVHLACMAQKAEEERSGLVRDLYGEATEELMGMHLDEETKKLIVSLRKKLKRK